MCVTPTSSVENYTSAINCSSIDLNFSNDSESYHKLFSEDSFREIIIYSILFAFAAVGNVSVFSSLLRNQHRQSRIKTMIMHLSVADMIVTFVMIPLEISWRITITWIAGDAMCKIMMLLRAFGPYLSSMILVCISLDRYFAVVYPLKVNDSRKRGKIMLSFAWIISFLSSIPQSVIFSVQSHPYYPTFLQCVSFSFFQKDSEKLAYNFFCLAALYFIPLLLIILCYARILWEMFRRSRDTRGDDDALQDQEATGRIRLRRSGMSNVERARSRTLRMTVVIVLAFFCCWTPYVMMAMWYLIDPVSADKVDSRIQSSLFIFAVSNSCVNPLVYGSYSLNISSFCGKLFRCFNCPRSTMLSRQPSVVSRITHGERFLNSTATRQPTRSSGAVHIQMSQYGITRNSNKLSSLRKSFVKNEAEHLAILSSSLEKSVSCDSHLCSIRSATFDTLTPRKMKKTLLAPSHNNESRIAVNSF